MLTAEKTAFIKLMQDAGVLLFGDFTLKSGRQSPYFCNLGNFRTGQQLDFLGKAYAAQIHRFVGADFHALFGPAYKGIPLAAVTAAALYREYGIDRPYCFDRKEAKDHGEGGKLVGYQPQDGDRLILTEDVITAGTALREVLPVLQAQANVTVTDMFIAVDRMEKVGDTGKTAVQQVRDEFGIAVHACVTIADIYDYLQAHGTDADLLKRMAHYRLQFTIESL
ncbi:MAG: orotate phosphoribosyltransferase [Oscillospiraceae bacterium]|jgi:orotate phosphoribosyltransferase|nr:orotate phosphoribosyltransferase [Oscillospiraceae bacterium]